MIYALIIALIGTSAITILLAILATLALRANSRLTREKNAAMRALEEALAGKEALKAENGKLQQEVHYAHLDLAHVKGQNADLSEALEKTRLLYNKLLKENKELEARSTAL